MNILLANQSTAISDSEVQAIMQVLQVQAWRDFCPAYGIEVPTLRFDAPGSLRDGEWLLSFFDTSDEAGALGYHDLSPAGTPLGKVFAKTDLMYGSLVSVTASHELLEMLADPHIDKDVPGTLNHRRVRFAYEVGDAVEADALGYVINGLQVSDFVLPPWFKPGKHKKGTRFSFMDHVHKPFELAPGGYIGYLYKGTWHSLDAQKCPGYESRWRVGSRRERRRVGKDRWTYSHPVPHETIQARMARTVCSGP
jgi:hypothetical protein